ncbi:hypothetical protein BDZ94DRAFT_1321877 [Collybia nuda]|uniref:Novel STAND NTPase 1 domain-containing protein n=1 Tax=Collybia nuda TaxID=64659 RepID=A0A9P5Y7U4_9AGAR|nr:hypothetical protein BDZ94DRAFT_1321877 [Collybia nuda]
MSLIHSSFPAPPVIYGRNEAIKEIIDHIGGKFRTLVILGVPGIGKTCVASAVLYEPQIVERFGIHRHWADLGDVESLDDFRNVILQSLSCEAPVISDNGISTMSIRQDRYQPSRTQISFSTLGQPKVLPGLLVLNDFENVWNSNWKREAEDFLHELLNMPELKILITMRGAMGLPQDWWRVEINPLSLREAKQAPGRSHIGLAQFLGI